MWIPEKINARIALLCDKTILSEQRIKLLWTSDENTSASAFPDRKVVFRTTKDMTFDSILIRFELPDAGPVEATIPINPSVTGKYVSRNGSTITLDWGSRPAVTIIR